MKEICRDRRFRNHPKDREKAIRADRRLRTMTGRLVRESKRNVKGNHDHDRLLELFETILSQRRNGRKKTCSIHEPEVQCISKGKEHEKYEFVNKEINGTKIVIPDVPKKSDSSHQGLKKRKLFRKRAGMEASIGHLNQITAGPQLL